MRTEMTRKQFDSMIPTYKRIKLSKTYKNGSEDYTCVGVCAKCNGTGHLTWTSVNQGVCYSCDGTGEITFTIHIITEEQEKTRKLKIKERQEQQLIERAKQKEENIARGYKLVDFKLAGWFCNEKHDVAYMKDYYYLIIKETSKAICINYLADIESKPYETFNEWFPKSAIIK